MFSNLDSKSFLFFKNVFNTLDENLLFIINEKFIDFDYLKDNGFDLRKTIRKQKLNDYFYILYGPIYINLVKEFWLNAFVEPYGHDDESI